jgi:hypothetical protein
VDFARRRALPDFPQHHVLGFDLQCLRFACAYDQASGVVTVTSTNTTDDGF